MVFEATWAGFTLKWPFVAVDWLMRMKMVAGFEALATSVAWKWSIAEVNLQMILVFVPVLEGC